MAKIVLGLPHTGYLTARLAEYCCKLARDDRHDMEFAFVHDGIIDSNRNKLIKDFLEDHENEYLIMIDYDNPPRSAQYAATDATVHLVC